MSTHRLRSTLAASFALGALVLIALAVIALAGMGLLFVDTPLDGGSQPAAAVAVQNDSPSEAPYEEPVPEPGDEYFEAAAGDGSWVSYENPRDEYREPYLGDGSGKICVTLLNEEGSVVVGESVPNTSVTIPTGDATSWHTRADPMTVQFPLTDHYERPLDADQFGTAYDVAQGDGLLDAHCIELHGLPENATVEYGEARIDGEHADSIEVVGYVQQAHEAWDTDVDPVTDARSYEEAGGWTYEPDGSHGQAVVVLQLDPATADVGGEGTNGSDDGTTDDTSGDSGPDDGWDRLPGFTPLAALVAISLVILAGRYRR